MLSGLSRNGRRATTHIKGTFKSVSELILFLKSSLTESPGFSSLFWPPTWAEFNSSRIFAF